MVIMHDFEQIERSAPFEGQLPILYLDEHYVAVNKPPGLLVHRAKQTPREEPVLLQMCRDQIGKFLYPVHRLDRPTSGVIVFGLTSEAAARLGELIAGRRVRKVYRAIVRGFLYPAGKVDLPLRERFGEGEADYILEHHPVQHAMTRYRTLRWFELPWAHQSFATCRYALMEAEPETGRWHQIRRHLKHISHPIIGDKRHGDHRHNDLFAAHFAVDRMLLVARELHFVHPYLRKPITLISPHGEGFDAVMEQLSAFEVEMNLAKLPPQPDSQRV